MGNIVYNEDCMIGMGRYPDKFFSIAICDIPYGIDVTKISALNASSLNNFDPDCIHCPYQAFCGTDVVDDLSRYGRVDISRLSTWFCKRHLALFDKIFELINRDDEATRQSLASWAGVNSWQVESGARYP